MTIEAFQASLSADTPSPHLPEYLQALWFDAKGNWEAAHDLINDLKDEQAAWVHAYLHRKEGDLGNAQYWYHRAGKPMPAIALPEEWKQIVRELL